LAESAAIIFLVQPFSLRKERYLMLALFCIDKQQQRYFYENELST
jgi:hypothetical protein